MAANSRFDKFVHGLRGTGIGARLARGTLWSMASAVITRGLGLVAAMLAARLLGTEAFGEVGVAQQVVAMIGTLAGMAVGTTASRFIAAGKDHDRQRTGRVLSATAVWSWASAVLGGTALVVLAPWLAAGPLAAPLMADALLAAVPLLVFTLVSQAQTGGLAGFEAFRASATANAASGVLGIPLQLLGAWEFGAPGFVIGLAATELLRWLLGLRVLANAMTKAAVKWEQPRWADIRQLLSFGLPSMLASLLVGPVLLVSFAIVGRQPQGYAEVGLFQATQQYRNLLVFVSVQSAAAIVPVLAAAHAAQDRQGLGRGLRRASALSVGSSIPLSMLLTVLAPWAMNGFGPAFAGHSSLLFWLALLAPIQALNAVGMAILCASDRPWTSLLVTVVFAIGALTTVLQMPTSLGLILSQGLGSIPALAVIAWAMRDEWRA